MTQCVLRSVLSSLLLVAIVDADPAAQKQGWETKVIGSVRIEIPIDCKTDVQTKPGMGAVQKMRKFSFRTHVLDLELVFLLFPSGMAANLDVAAANMSSQLRVGLGEGSITPWKATTVSGRPARCIATKPARTYEARQATIIDDTKAGNQLVIVDISYDSSSASAKTDSERIMRSVEIK